MSSRLKAVAPKEAEPAKPKILAYGKPNAGKTWFATAFPNCYYIDSEGGANLKHYTERLDNAGGVYLGQEHGSNDFSVVLEQVKALATESHSYKTLVIDSVSHLFGTEIANEQDRLSEAHKKDEYGASKKPAVSYMRRIVNWLDRVDMNVILIAHQKAEYGLVKGENVVVGETFDCWDKLEYLLHLALHVTRQGTSHLARVRKSRLLQFPYADTFELSYDNFAERYGRDIIEAGTKKIELASPEQLTELRSLLDSVRMPEDWLEKCLKRSKADTLDEVSAENIAAMIDALKKRMP